MPLGDQPALAWSLRNGGLPDWATGIGPATLIIIDEAGMANTLSLDTAVEFAIDHGASVRLIGDDQQFAPSKPAASSATSNRHTAPCSSPSCTASPTGLSCHRRLECK